MAGRPARLQRQPGRRGHADLPARVEPRRRPATQHRRGHPPPPRRRPRGHVRLAHGDLAAPARPASACPVRRLSPACAPCPPGHSAGGRQWVADLEHEEPHLFIVAGTGGGKTATASIPAAHARAHGWLIDIIDPKRWSYIARKTGADVLTQRARHPCPHQHRSDDVGAGRVLPVHARRQHRSRGPRGVAGRIPQRMLVIDEFGTFAGMAARAHHRAAGGGPLPALDQRRQIEWQGRVAGHRLVVAVHQSSLRLFGDSDSRSQYGYRLITGAYTTSLWRMTLRLRTAHRMGRKDQRARRGRHRRSTLPDSPRADRLDARRRTPPLRPHRSAAARLARRPTPGPVDHTPRAGRRPQARRRLPGHHSRPPGTRSCRCPCPTRTAHTPPAETCPVSRPGTPPRPPTPTPPSRPRAAEVA